MIEIEITNFQSNAILCFLGHATWHAARFRALEHDCHMPRSLIWIFYWKPLAPSSHGQVRVSEVFLFLHIFHPFPLLGLDVLKEWPWLTG
jgi:hypothetical protein